MAVIFPVPLADFVTGLRIRSSVFYLPDALARTANRAGAPLRAGVATRLWRGSITLVPMLPGAATQQQAMLNRLGRPDATFLLTPPSARAPQADPTGIGLSGTTVTLNAIGASNRHEINLSGLPVGYILTPGDYLSFTHGGRHHFHQVDEGGAAGGAGAVNLTVIPSIPLGVTTGATVALVNPVLRAVLASDPTPATQAPGVADGIAFDWVQDLRA